MAYNLRTGLIGSGDIDVNVNLTGLSADNIPNLSATKITSGVFASADRIPTLPASKIDSNTTFAKSMINTAQEWSTTDIPDLPASKITRLKAVCRKFSLRPSFTQTCLRELLEGCLCSSSYQVS